MRCSLLIVIIFSYLYSCAKEEIENIEIIETRAKSISKVFLSDVFFKIDKVALENTFPLIRNLTKVLKTKEYIFVIDWQSEGARILQFDLEGIFIKQIGNIGHGPGEYFNFFDLAVDTITNNVFVATYYQILNYDTDGRFIMSIPVNIGGSGFFMVDFMCCINSQLWTFQRKTIPPNNTCNKWRYFGELIRYDKQSLDIDTLRILQALFNENRMSGLTEKYCLSKVDDRIFVYYPMIEAEPILRDTIYELKDFKKTPVIRLDFSEILSIDATIDLKGMNPQMRMDASHKIRTMIINNIYRTQRYIFAEYNRGEYYYNNEHYLFCYDLNHHISYNLKEGFTDDLYNTGIASLKPSDLQQGEFYFVKNGYEVEGIIDGVKESSNPVIFFVRTKKEEQ